MNPKSPKLKVGDRVRVTKYKNILAKVTLKIWDVDVNNIFVSKLVKTRLILLGI